MMPDYPFADLAVQGLEAKHIRERGYVPPELIPDLADQGRIAVLTPLECQVGREPHTPNSLLSRSEAPMLLEQPTPTVSLLAYVGDILAVGSPAVSCWSTAPSASKAVRCAAVTRTGQARDVQALVAPLGLQHAQGRASVGFP